MSHRENSTLAKQNVYLISQCLIVKLQPQPNNITEWASQEVQYYCSSLQNESLINHPRHGCRGKSDSSQYYNWPGIGSGSPPEFAFQFLKRATVQVQNPKSPTPLFDKSPKQGPLLDGFWGLSLLWFVSCVQQVIVSWFILEFRALCHIFQGFTRGWIDPARDSLVSRSTITYYCCPINQNFPLDSGYVLC